MWHNYVHCNKNEQSLQFFIVMLYSEVSTKGTRFWLSTESYLKNLCSGGLCLFASEGSVLLGHHGTRKLQGILSQR